MSTKSTLAYETAKEGLDYHLYTDCFDEDPMPVYLELTGTGIEASLELIAGGVPKVTVMIPLSVWDEIRKHTPGEGHDGKMLEV